MGVVLIDRWSSRPWEQGRSARAALRALDLAETFGFYVCVGGRLGPAGTLRASLEFWLRLCSEC